MVNLGHSASFERRNAPTAFNPSSLNAIKSDKGNFNCRDIKRSMCGIDDLNDLC